MNHMQQTENAESFGIKDGIYVLSKHKLLIILLSILGFMGSYLVYFNRDLLYESQAKLLVRYVLNRNSVDSIQNQMNPSGAPGDQVINTEIQILTSFDLSKKVAEQVGIEKILPDWGDSATVSDAAGTILESLEVVAVPGNVVTISYSNKDAELAVEVLEEIVKQYGIRHLQIHRSAAAFDAVSKEAVELQKNLLNTELELDNLRKKTGITSLADATGALASQRAKTMVDLMGARAELAEQTARVNALEKAFGRREQANLGDANGPDLGKPDESGPLPARIMNEYQAATEVIQLLRKRDMELRLKFRSGNRLITMNEQQIADHENRRDRLLVSYPELASLASTNTESQNNEWDLVTERAKLSSIKAKVEVFDKHLSEIKEQFNEQYGIGAQIESLDRKRQIEDEEYRLLEQNLKNAKVDQTLDPTRMPNITLVQNPSQPVATYDKLTQKIIIGLAGSGLGSGLVLAFLIELLFDRKVRRPHEIQGKLQIPLILSVPYIEKTNRRNLLIEEKKETVPKLDSKCKTNSMVPLHKNLKKIPDHFIQPYTETIRDRMIFNFEINNIQHKPKLVAVTSLSSGGGASTLAAGLARSFSEIKGVKVLLIDVNSNHQDENSTYGEVVKHSIHGALQIARNVSFRDSNQSLYFAASSPRNDRTELKSFSPLQLFELLPHLQASEYDYIFFDMPKLSPTSRTLAMAGLMDKVLLVLDAGNTNRDMLKWGYSELKKGRADVSCVFNKTRSNTTEWLGNCS
jgi:uncharacterized protein involved in exopolysaccharide biosynthesis/Mrp family chromosome partitioning ATPase